MIDSKDLVRKFYETAFVQHDLAKAALMLDNGFVLHDPSRPGPVKGHHEWQISQALYMDAVPDHHLTIQMQFCEGDLVATHWITEGTQKGDLPGISATGKKFAITGISITRVSNGKIVEEWMNWDTLGFLEQLGALTVPKIQKVA